MGRVTGKELCQRLKAEVETDLDIEVDNDLRLRILDYLIARDLPDDGFEQILRARIADPDPAKEQSKAICAQILKAWRTNNNPFGRNRDGNGD